jgi:hypothetical protein
VPLSWPSQRDGIVGALHARPGWIEPAGYAGYVGYAGYAEYTEYAGRNRWTEARVRPHDETSSWPQGSPDAVSTTTAEDPWAWVSEVLDIPIENITYTRGRYPWFIVHTPSGRVRLTAKQLQLFTTSNAGFASQIRHILPHSAKKQWYDIWPSIVRLAIPEEGVVDDSQQSLDPRSSSPWTAQDEVAE